MWVACGAANEVMEYNTSDNALVRTVTGVTSPRGLVYDGASIWVSNYTNPGTVTKIQASTGTILGTFTVGGNPVGMAFDGQYVWVANSLNYGGVSKISAATGAVTNYPLSTCNSPYGLAFDGTYIWVTCSNSSNVLMLSSSGSVQRAFTVASGPSGVGTAGGGATYVACTSGKVYQLDTAGNSWSISLSCPAGVRSDGAYLWVTSPCANTISQSYTWSSWTTYTAPSTSSFMAFDGGNMWVSNTTTGTLAKF